MQRYIFDSETREFSVVDSIYEKLDRIEGNSPKERKKRIERRKGRDLPKLKSGWGRSLFFGGIGGTYASGKVIDDLYKKGYTKKAIRKAALITGSAGGAASGALLFGAGSLSGLIGGYFGAKRRFNQKFKLRPGGNNPDLDD